METQIPKRLPALRQMLRTSGVAATAFALTPILSGCTGTDYDAVAYNARFHDLNIEQSLTKLVRPTTLPSLL